MDTRKALVSSLTRRAGGRASLWVAASEGAQAVCAKNGTAGVQLLAPFAGRRETPVVLASPGGPATPLDLEVSVKDMSEAACPPLEVLDASIAAAVAAIAGRPPPPSPAVSTATSQSAHGAAGAASKPEGSSQELSIAGPEVVRASLPALVSAIMPAQAALRSELNEAMRTCPQEMFDCPLAIIIMVSTIDPSPVDAVRALHASVSASRAFVSEQYPPDIPRVVVLVHDVFAGSSGNFHITTSGADADATPLPVHPPGPTLSALSAALAPGVCHFLPINSLAPTKLALSQGDIWRPYIVDAPVPSMQPFSLQGGVRPALPPDAPSRAELQSAAQAFALNVSDTWHDVRALSAYHASCLQHGWAPVRGCCLNGDDLLALRTFCDTVMNDYALPALQNRINAAAAAVSTAKRGLRDTLRSFWGGNASGAGSGSPSPSTSSGGSSTPTPAGAALLSRTVLPSAAAAVGAAVADRAAAVGSSLLGTLSAASSAMAAVTGSASARGSAAATAPPTATASVDEVVFDVTGVVFPASSYEATLRFLADSLMLMRDYDTAAAYYRRLRDEVRVEKAPTYHAAACEAAAIATLLSGLSMPGGMTQPLQYSWSVREAVHDLLSQARKGYEKAIAAANANAQAAASLLMSAAHGTPNLEAEMACALAAKKLATRMLTRCDLLGVDITLMHVTPPSGTPPAACPSPPAINQLIRDTAGFLRRVGYAEGDTSLIYALCTEYAALTYLRTSPPSYRKAAQLFAHAGQLYTAASANAIAPQSQHAIRALSIALSVYERGVGWTLIEDHLSLSLASRMAAFGSVPAACTYFLHVLTSGGRRLPLESQRAVLQELTSTYTTACDAGSLGVDARDPWRALQLMGLPLTDAAAPNCSISSSGNAWTAAAVVYIADAASRAQRAAFRMRAPAALPPSSSSSSSHELDWPAMWPSLGTGDALLQVRVEEASPHRAAFALPLLFSTVPGEGLYAGAHAAEGPIISPAAIISIWQRAVSAAVCGGGAHSMLAGAAVQPTPPAIALAHGAQLPGLQPFITMFTTLPTLSLHHHMPPVASTEAGASDAPVDAWQPAAESQVVAPDARRPLLFATLAAAVRSQLATLPPAQARAALSLLLSLSASCVPLSASDTPTPPTPHALWNKLEAALARDVRVREKAGNAAVLSSSWHDAACDWEAICGQVAAQMEDEREARDKSGGGGGSSGGAEEESNTAFVAGKGWVDGDSDFLEEWYALAQSAVAAAAAAGGSVLSGLVGARPATGVADLVGSVLSSTLHAFDASGRDVTAAMQATCHPPNAMSSIVTRYVDEVLTLSVTLRNPTGLELPITRVHCVGEFTPPTKGAAPITSLSIDTPLPANRCPTLWPADDAADVLAPGFVSRAVDVVLQPFESRVVRLPIRICLPDALHTPGGDAPSGHAPGGGVLGQATVTGIRWLLGGVLPMMTKLEPRGPPLNDTKQHRMSSARVHDRRLTFKIAAAREWAGLQVHWDAGGCVDANPAYPYMYDTEVRSLVVTLTNHGALPISTLILRTFGKGRIFTSLCSSAVEKRGAAAHTGAALQGLDGSTIHLPLTAATARSSAALHRGASETVTTEGVDAIPPGGWAQWRLFVRANGAGERTLRLMFMYGHPAPSHASDTGGAGGDSGDCSALRSLKSFQRLRCVRWVSKIRVLPSIAASLHLQPAPAGMMYMQVRVTHIGSEPRGNATLPASSPSHAGSVPAPFNVDGLTLVSDYWRLAEAQPSITVMYPSLASGMSSGNSVAGVSNPQAIVTPAVDVMDGMTSAHARSAPRDAPYYGDALHYRSTHVYTYRLVPRDVPTLTFASPLCNSVDVRRGLPGGDAHLAELLAAGWMPRRRAVALLEECLGCIPADSVPLLMSQHASETVASLVARLQREERERRRAAAAMESLPPSLRTIANRRQEKAAALLAARRSSVVAADVDEAGVDAASHDTLVHIGSSALPSRATSLFLQRRAVSVALTWSTPAAPPSDAGVVPALRGIAFASNLALPTQSQPVVHKLTRCPQWAQPWHVLPLSHMAPQVPHGVPMPLVHDDETCSIVMTLHAPPTVTFQSGGDDSDSPPPSSATVDVTVTFSNNTVVDETAASMPEASAEQDGVLQLMCDPLKIMLLGGEGDDASGNAVQRSVSASSISNSDDELPVGMWITPRVWNCPPCKPGALLMVTLRCLLSLPVDVSHADATIDLAQFVRGVVVMPGADTHTTITALSPCPLRITCLPLAAGRPALGEVASPGAAAETLVSRATSAPLLPV